MPRGRWHRSPHVACRLYLYLPTFPSSEKVPVLTKEGKEKAETVNELLNLYNSPFSCLGFKRSSLALRSIGQ